MKKIITLLLALSVTTAALPVLAAEQPSKAGNSYSVLSSTEITPRADVIKIVFREYNGKTQMRRWNQTWGYWVDPDWITISQ